MCCSLDGIKAQMAHAKAVNRKKNWDDDDPEGAASGLNTPITGKMQKTILAKRCGNIIKR